MPIDAIRAAAEINARWQKCLGINQMTPVNCPTDDEIAEIITEHLKTEQLKTDKEK